MPGIATRPRRFELTALEADLDALPDRASDNRTEVQGSHTHGVVWLDVEGAGLLDEWNQGSFERQTDRNNVGRPSSVATARWTKASIEPATGVVTLGDGAPGLPCHWLQLDTGQPERFPAMPQRCPACSMDYSERRGGRLSPIRSFRDRPGQGLSLARIAFGIGIAAGRWPEAGRFFGIAANQRPSFP